MLNINFKEGALEKVMEANAKNRPSYPYLKKASGVYDIEGNKVLDVGIHGDIWPGGHKFLFNKAVYETVDIDSKVLPTHVADIRELPFNDDTYDLIICHSVIEHILEDREKAYSELYRVLKKGGLLVYNIPIYLERESEPSSVVSRTQFEEFHKDKDYKFKVLPDRTYYMEVRK